MTKKLHCHKDEQQEQEPQEIRKQAQQPKHASVSEGTYTRFFF